MMKTVWLVGALVLLAVPAGAADRPVERGKYLVERVALCADCHTARDRTGKFVKTEWLRGAPIGFKPVMEMPWADYAPRIAGLPQGWTRTQLAAFLQTGRRPDGSSPRPPMPEFRLDKNDAEAVAAYIASLK